MELVEDFGAKGNKCSKINEYINIFFNIPVVQDHYLTFNQSLLYFNSFKQSGLFK